MTRGADVALPSLADERVRTFLRSVYGWMCIGLGITAVTAMFVAGSPALISAIATNRLLFWGIVIAQFGIVFVLSARVQTLAPSTASMLFIAYSALTGVTLSFVLLAVHRRIGGEHVPRGRGHVRRDWRCTARRRKRSLAGFGQFLFMGLIGLVLATFVGMFWHNDGLQFMISFVGVFVFTGLAAYDAQRLKQMALALPVRADRLRTPVVGALSLYLDFINLFLMLLRFTGSRRD